MEVILLEKIGRLGNIGDRVRVRAGYGRNYLIPQGKAVFATQENVARFEARRAELEQLAAARLGEAQALADQIAQIGSLTLSAVAGEGGKLFGSVSARDIADALAAGDIKLAAKILWLTLKMEWQKGVHFLNGIWQEVVTFFVKSWTKATFTLSRGMVSLGANMERGWLETNDFMADAWAVTCNGLAVAFRDVMGKVQKAWAFVKGLFEGLSMEEIAVQVAQVDQETAAGNKKDSESFAIGIDARATAREKRHTAIDDAETGTLAELDDDERRRNAARDKAHAANVKGTQRDLDDARSDWQKSLDEARHKAFVTGQRGTDDVDALPTIGELTDKVGDGLGVAQRTAETKGSFSAFAVRGMQTGGPAQRIAKATEKTAESTKSMDEQMAEQRGVLFSN